MPVGNLPIGNPYVKKNSEIEIKHPKAPKEKVTKKQEGLYHGIESDLVFLGGGYRFP